MNATAAIITATFLTLAASAADSATMTRDIFLRTENGQIVERFTLTNKNGITARVITYGATLTELRTPDRDGKFDDITLGFDSAEAWMEKHPFFGVVAGRYANRIAGATFTLDGKKFLLAANNGPNHLHGGITGFDKRHWKAEAAGPCAVRLTYLSPDGEEGYPGTLTASVTYTLTDADELRLDYTATTDAPTVINLTNHAYFNLGPGADILGHTLRLHASRYTAVDGQSIPTGELAKAAGAMDFTTAKPIGRDLDALKETPGGGYDHNYILDGWEPGKLVPAAELHDPASGRTLTVSTTEPGVQLYTGNYLKGVKGRAGKTYNKHAGLCLETQHFPDSPNQPEFPTTVLRPGETFKSTTVLKFGVKK